MSNLEMICMNCEQEAVMDLCKGTDGSSEHAYSWKCPACGYQVNAFDKSKVDPIPKIEYIPEVKRLICIKLGIFNGKDDFAYVETIKPDYQITEIINKTTNDWIEQNVISGKHLNIDEHIDEILGIIVKLIGIEKEIPCFKRVI